MTIDQLKYFVSLYKYGSIYKASRPLYISPQGISRGIKKLEDEIGHELFIRTQSGLRPTTLAEKLYPRALQITEQFDELQDLAMNDCSSSDTIRVGLLGHNAISDTFRTAVEAFCAEYVDARVALTVFSADDYESMYKKLNTGELDLMWTFHTETDPKYRYYSFRRSALKCAMSVSNQLAEKDSLNWNDLREQTFISAGKNELFPHLIAEQCQKYDFVPHDSYYSVDSVHMAKLIGQGKAMTLLFFEYIDTLHALNPDIVFRTVEPELFISGSVITRWDNSRPEVKQLAEYLQACLLNN